MVASYGGPDLRNLDQFRFRERSLVGAGGEAARAVQALLAHGAHLLDRSVGAGFRAQPAVKLLARSNAHTAFGQPRTPRQQSAVGAQVAAIRPPDEHSEHEESGADRHHVRKAFMAEEADERIIAA